MVHPTDGRTVLDTMQAHKRASWGKMLRDAKKRLSNDNDIKIIIQGANSQTGIGKTTLAIEICREIDPDWDAETKAFIDIQEYLNSYLDYPEGSALLLDEIGAGADSRRSTSSENVDLSHGWQMLRARNIATVATLPSTSMLDKRMMELADYWVLVKARGIAQPYQINVNDFNAKIQRDPLPGEEHIKFPDLPDDDPDKEYLDNIKDKKVRGGGMKSIKVSEHKEKLEKARDEAKKEMRNELIVSMAEKTDLSYSDIGDIPAIDLAKQTVSDIVNRAD